MMNFVKRALLYVTRKKGKSLLLFFMLLTMATFVLTCLSIWKASEMTQLNLRQSLGGKFEIAVNWSDNNPYLVNDTTEEYSTINEEGESKQITNSIMYSKKQLSPENVKDVKQIPGVKYCDARNEVLTIFEELSLFAGNIPVMKEHSKETKVMGIWRSEENELFTSGVLTLAEGQHITENDTHAAIISKDLAEKSGLKPGDTITTHSTSGKEILVRIQGLFLSGKTEKLTDMVTTYDKIQNLVFTDLNTAIELEDSPAVQGFHLINVTIEDPEAMDKIMSGVKDLSSIDWEAFEINKNNETYQKAAMPLAALKELVVTLLLVIIVVSAVILALILTLWTKTRIHEIGVFLSVGIRKSAIIGQFLMEVLLIAIFAFGFSFFTSNVMAQQIGNQLLEQSIQTDGIQTDDDAVRGAAVVMSETDTLLENPTTDANIHVGVGFDTLVLLYVIGFAVIIVAVSLSSVTVMWLKPREILSKMS